MIEGGVYAGESMAQAKDNPEVTRRHPKEATDLSIIRIKNGWLVLARDFETLGNAANYKDSVFAATTEELGEAVVSAIGKQRITA